MVIIALKLFVPLSQPLPSNFFFFFLFRFQIFWVNGIQPSDTTKSFFSGNEAEARTRQSTPDLTAPALCVPIVILIFVLHRQALSGSNQSIPQ